MPFIEFEAQRTFFGISTVANQENGLAVPMQKAAGNTLL